LLTRQNPAPYNFQAFVKQNEKQKTAEQAKLYGKKKILATVVVKTTVAKCLKDQRGSEIDA